MSEETTTSETEGSILDQVVQVKGNEKFKDPEVLAKSVLAADDHIKNLERQLKEMREDLSNRMTAEEALKALDAKAEELASRSFRREEVETPEKTTTTGVNPEQVEAIVTEALQKRTQEETFRSNLELVNRQLSETFGAEAVNAVKTRAQELGLAPDRLIDMAKESPNAFMAMMGQKPVKSTNSVAPSEVNTADRSFNDTNQERNFAFYEKIRKENPKQYYDPKFQKQMHRDISRLGDSFL